jgi:Na+-transporting NADH:ubiquinone oxidoreductase subunit C
LADLNPLSAWKRFLALPNESRTKTIAMAFIVAAVCALLVNGATVILRPIQAANRAHEQQVRLEALISAIPGMSELIEKAGGDALSAVVINLDTGWAAKNVTPDTLEAALQDPSNWRSLTPEEDIAGLGKRPNYAQIYILRDGENVSLAILPIAGAGYQGPIQGMLAIHGDMNTIAGLAITEQMETPGLGGRIEEPAWLAQFPGTKIRDPSGKLRFTIQRGSGNNEYEVDGITGATRTSNAMTKIIRFWVGPDGYGKFFDAVQRGEF